MPRWCDEAAGQPESQNAASCRAGIVLGGDSKPCQRTNFELCSACGTLAQLFCTASFACSSESSLNERLARRRPAGLANVATEVTNTDQASFGASTRPRAAQRQQHCTHSPFACVVT